MRLIDFSDVPLDTAGNSIVGGLFCVWMEENHPGALLLHIERTAGSRQDIMVKGTGVIY